MPLILGATGPLLFILTLFLLSKLASKPNKNGIKNLVSESYIFNVYHWQWSTVLKYLKRYVAISNRIFQFTSVPYYWAWCWSFNLHRISWFKKMCMSCYSKAWIFHCTDTIIKALHFTRNQWNSGMTCSLL